MYPGRPLSIADELESFLHVLIYLAVRFLRMGSLNVWRFVENYFEGFEQDGDNKVICGHVKEKIIRTGTLMWGEEPIRFLSTQPPPAARDVQRQDADSEPHSPLNEIIENYLAFFKARYAVLEYERQVSTKPLHSLQRAIETATSSSAVARTKDLRRANNRTKGYPLSSSSGSKLVPPLDSKRPQKPAPWVYEMAASLETHDAILDMLTMEVDTRDWPSDDYAGDQLLGYIPLQLQSMAKRARVQMQDNMKSIPEGEELPQRAQSGA